MVPASGETPRVPEGVERLVKQLVVTHKAVGLYPSSSAIPRENAQAVIDILRFIFRERGDMRLAVTKDGLLFDDVPVFSGQGAYTAFALELYNRNVAEVRFHTSVAERDVIALFEILKIAPAELAGSGGIGAQLWEREVDAVTVTEVSAKIVDADGSEGESDADLAGEPWPPDSQRVDEIIAGAFAGQPRDKRMLIRVMRDPALLGKYFEETLAARGARSPEAEIESNVASLAHVVKGEMPGDQPELYRGLAEAMLGLEPELRRKLVRDKLLGDARKDDALAAVVRSMHVEEICEILVEGLAEGEATVEGVSRAIRNLALISLSGRDEVLEAAGTAMAAAGVSEGTMGAVLENAAPSRLVVKERPQTAEETPVDSVVRLIDLAPAPGTHLAGDPKMEALREEARVGVSDADVMGALVTLVTLDVRPEPFSTAMSMVEDNLGLLLERDEFEAAADAVAALTEAEKDRRLSTAQRRRVRNAVATLAKPAEMRTINKAMRVFPSGTRENAACRRLLELLGRIAIEPLLELLADEQDMQARKVMVDLISGLAPRFIDGLGEHVADRRWYFVRNVVSILGHTHQPEALTHLERTLRHVDPRVRRETIRSVAAIKDLRAEQMLAAALGDEDAANVTLAARYVGLLALRGSVPTLEMVARGEGKGNRDVGPRVEAIESLGRIAPESSISVLEQLSEKRGLLRRGVPKEITAAAETAIAQIRRRAAAGGAGR